MIDAWRGAGGAATCIVLMAAPEEIWLLHELTLCATQGLGGAYWNKGTPSAP